MIQRDGRSWHPGRMDRRFYKIWFRLRRAMARDVEIADGDLRYRFRCGSYRELSRCMNLFAKEEGTCRWIAESLQPGDVFYDVGANIGIYTIVAGWRVGPRGRVCAFEPHVANFRCLLENVALNDLEDRVTPCNFALAPRQDLVPFHYSSVSSGSSDSQLDTRTRADGSAFAPLVSELKFAVAADQLISEGRLPAPQLVKIDVDGNELPILRGMAGVLSGPDRPRSVQVEVNVLGKEKLLEFLGSHGYELVERHHTRTALSRIRAGADPEALPYNAIFRPA